MDHCEILRPIFSYIAHLIVSAADTRLCVCDCADVHHDLEKLVEAARIRLIRNGDEAFFALSAWAREKLHGIPGGDDLANAVFPVSGKWESAFFQRLEHLLHRHEDGQSLTDDLAAIEVYSLCLELGFRGCHARPGQECKLDGYRDRCREILSTEAARLISSAGRSEQHSGAGRAVLAAALWIAPAAVTLLLFALYRLLLSDLYSTILG